jgi:hypothetical protein
MYRSSPLAVLGGVVLILFGLAVALLGAWTLTQGPELSDLVRRLTKVDLLVFQPTREQLETAFSLTPGLLMVFGVLQLLVGAVVLAHRGWARWLGILLALLGLLVTGACLSAILALVPGVSLQLIIAGALVVGYAFVVLALIAAGNHFRARYPGR